MNFQIIVEFGSNWWQPERAEALAWTKMAMTKAQRAGAHSFKLQLFRAEFLYSKARAPEQWTKVKQYEFPIEWLPELRAHADGLGIELWASCFDTETLWKAVPLLHGLKVASGDITNESLLTQVEYAAIKYHLPVALSTGAATMGEIEVAATLLQNVPFLILMHCVSAYPAPTDKLNLDTLRGFNAYPIPYEMLGFSDHTACGVLAAQLAYSLGARYFEMHYTPTWSGTQMNPDYEVSRTAEDVKHYIAALNLAERMLGESKHGIIDPIEANERIWARRGKDGLRPNL